jgi:thioredoxin reductase
MEEILVYGASWCPDCRRAKKFLADQRVSYGWHDIESEPDGVKVVQERGFVATDPTFMSSMPVVFAAGDVRDGSTKQLASAVGEGAAAAIQIRGYLDRLEQRRTA